MLKKVSILVAVYNSVKWLPRCLESLCTQSYSNVEIICVDDASSDGSLQVLKEFALKYDFIKVISFSTNKGPAIARNEAYRISSGEFITMVDSDDWLSKDAIQSAVDVLNKNEDTNCVLFRLVYHNEESGKEEAFVNKTSEDVLDGVEAMRLAIDWNIHGLYVARRWLYEVYPFDTSGLLYSDDNTARQHYLHSGKVRFCDGIYYYYQHSESMLHNPGIRFVDWMEATASLKQMLIDEQQPEYLINHIESRLWQNIVAVSGYYWRSGKLLTDLERSLVRERIKMHHAKIETHRLPFSLKCKFGFIPFKGFFSVFMLQELIYFYLRKTIKGI